MITKLNKKVLAVLLASMIAGATSAGATVTYSYRHYSKGLVGTIKALTASVSTLDFGTLNQGSSSDKSLSLQNTGTAAVIISGISVALGIDNFGQSNNCGTSLAVGNTCLITVKATPSISGALNGKLGILSDADAPTLSIALSAYGNALLANSLGTLTVPSSAFGATPFFIAQPSSSSAGAFSYFSSNTAVATLSPASGGATVTIVGIGSSSITATQAANGNYADASTSAVLSVNAAGPTLGTFSIPAKIIGDAAFSLTQPTSNSLGDFSYTSSDPTVATVSGTTLTLLKMGSTTITATQAATPNYSAKSTTATALVNGKAVTLTAFTVAAHAVGDTAFALTAPTATPSSGGAFTYTSDTPSVATVSGNMVTIVGQGQALITATQASAANYASTSIAASLVVGAKLNTYAIWSYSDKSTGMRLSNGNLTYSADGGWHAMRATQGKSTGKWYWETTIPILTGSRMLGIANSAFVVQGGTIGESGSYGYNAQGNAQSANGLAGATVGSVSFTYAPVAGDTYMFALDMDNHAFYIGKNGAWAGTPSSGSLATGATLKGFTGTIYPAVSGQNTGFITTNFGATTFSYPSAVPAGYNAGFFN